MEVDLKRIKGTREVTTIGGPKRAINVEIDPARMAAMGVTIQEVRGVLASANMGAPVGNLLVGDTTVALESGPFLKNADDVRDLVMAVRTGSPVYLKDIANIADGPMQARRMVWHAQMNPETKKFEEYPSVTIAITKKPGENAIDVANQVRNRIAELKET